MFRSHSLLIKNHIYLDNFFGFTVCKAYIWNEGTDFFRKIVNYSQNNHLICYNWNGCLLDSDIKFYGTSILMLNWLSKWNSIITSLFRTFDIPELICQWFSKRTKRKCHTDDKIFRRAAIYGRIMTVTPNADSRTINFCPYLRERNVWNLAAMYSTQIINCMWSLEFLWREFVAPIGIENWNKKYSNLSLYLSFGILWN